ncbi:CDP-diacylglycerol--glycerol-3-phosphate 3-phosphatidyltransferase [Anaerobranca gottschalkii]|uniref:CDP-diacylglycerol--glycerol-3-phosphate 3-phosphatidyltransferase n=1 Tax=Anaerobranca gottschalkii DSM 13577 TaxID=1120990 RepID=A0A1H9Z7V9_9FIRM|nr:CDP-diacylglycerol--glycerol-3-phosphate 3-phosphatidyltransferase [Anaerobranca gottschalkii]SES77623.1 CDP-diacylglycerol--glycerol-3-phosphate 3-phosphatidyltransferase [Anaerobranca gottschalkii DSM 13577]
MNLANKITLARIFLAPIFIVLIVVRIPFGQLIAAAFFIIAASTDGLDGYIARKHKQVTNFGKFLDPLADKLLISAALFALVWMKEISPLIAFIILSREFAVTGLRVIAAGEGIVISASKWGKLKTISQIVAISAITIHAGLLTEIDIPLFKWILNNLYIDTIAMITLYIAVFLTIFSGIDYFYKNIKVIKKGGSK